jgi:hypothetical protein
MKFFFLGLLLLSLSGSGIHAQTVPGGDPFGSGLLGVPDASPTPAEEAKKAPATSGTAQGSTTIDSENMDYDEKTRIAIFTGEDYGVFVKDPSFTVYCDKLTAHMRKASAPAPAIPGAPKVKPTPTPAATPGGKGSAAEATASKTSGLQRAIAEGNADYPVVIVQDKPAANGGEPEHDVGIALKADYNADTGDVILTGWPRVSQGINTQIATSQDTVMIMNKVSHAMKTIGPSRTVIQEQDQAKKTGTNSESSDSSPSPSPQ